MSYSRRRARSRFLALPEISLTPLIDTALTLLIIFMVTTPMLNKTIKVQLPQAAARLEDAPTRDLVISIKNDGAVFVGEQSVTDAALVQTVVRELPKYLNKVVVIQGDGAVSYNRVIEVVDVIKQVEGVEQVALLVAPRRS